MSVYCPCLLNKPDKNGCIAEGEFLSSPDKQGFMIFYQKFASMSKHIMSQDLNLIDYNYPQNKL